MFQLWLVGLVNIKASIILVSDKSMHLFYRLVVVIIKSVYLRTLEWNFVFSRKCSCKIKSQGVFCIDNFNIIYV